jgi:hypothetical protein
MLIAQIETHATRADAIESGQPGPSSGFAVI